MPECVSVYHGHAAFYGILTNWSVWARANNLSCREAPAAGGAIAGGQGDIARRSMLSLKNV